MKAHDYAEALYLSTHNTGVEQGTHAVDTLVTLLRTKGHERLLASIVRSFEQRTKKRATGVQTLVRVAESEDEAVYAARIAADVLALGAEGMPYVVQVDPAQIGGYAVRAKGQQIDRTYKRTLIDMYRTFTSS